MVPLAQLKRQKPTTAEAADFIQDQNSGAPTPTEITSLRV
jgi:hypothetical protein